MMGSRGYEAGNPGTCRRSRRSLKGEVEMGGGR